MCAGRGPRLARTTRPRDSCCAAHGVLLSGWVQHMGSEIQGTAASCSVAGPVGGTLHVITNLSRSSAPSRGISRCPASVPGPEWGSFVAFGAMMVDVPLMTSLLDETSPASIESFMSPSLKLSGIRRVHSEVSGAPHPALTIEESALYTRRTLTSLKSFKLRENCDKFGDQRTVLGDVPK